MLLLVLADRDEIGLVKQDVGGHQDGIREKADAGAFAVAAGLRHLVLELRHPLKLAHSGDA